MKPKLKLIPSFLMVSNVLLINLWLVLPATVQAQTAPATTTQTNSVPQANNNPIIKYSGPEDSIRRFLCVPNISNPSGTAAPQDVGTITDTAAGNPAAGDLATCVNRLYRFAGAIGAFAAVFFVALAGYYYILGGEKAKEKAKHIVISVIAGLVIIFTAYILLKQINPDAVKFKTIQPPTLGRVANFPDCGALRLPGQNCLLNGQIAVSTGSGQGSTYDVKECPTGIKPIPTDLTGKSGELGCQTLIDALVLLKQQNVPYTLHDAFGSGHQSLCHTQGGTCADITPNNGNYPALCKAVTAIGKFRILNESGKSSSECGTYVKTALSTGAHLHIILQYAKDDLSAK